MESVVVHIHLILILGLIPEIKELRNKDGINIKNKFHGWDVVPSYRTKDIASILPYATVCKNNFANVSFSNCNEIYCFISRLRREKERNFIVSKSTEKKTQMSWPLTNQSVKC